MGDSHKGGVGAAVEQEDAGPDEGPLSRWGQWRESLRRWPHAYGLYRIAVGVLGGAIVIGGLGLIPLPGPGWLIVFLGLAVLATEFEWARRLDRYARERVGAWTRWVGRQPLPVRALIGLATAAFLLALGWVLLRLGGVPGFVPDALTDWIPGLPH